MFANTVAQALTGAFREYCTSPLETAIAPVTPESLPKDQQSVWFSVHLEGSLHGRAYLAIKRAEISALALRDTVATQEDEGAALLKMVQSTGLRLQELAASAYGALTVSVEQTAGPALPDVRILEIYAKSEGGDTQATMHLCLEPQLMIGLQRLAGVLFPEAAPTDHSAENLGLVLDVELNATLRFGQRQLSLREVLDLTSGSVVELDRQVDEPVELVLDGRVIARGEAVVIDGNYGMRITEVLHPVNGITRSR